MVWTVLIFGTGIALFAGLVLCLVVAADRQRRRHTARLQRVRQGTALTIAPSVDRAKPRKNEKNSLFAHLDAQLAQTNLHVSITELMVQASLGTLGIYALSVLALGLHPLLAIPVAIAVPLLIVFAAVRIAQAYYRATFTEQLPEALDVFARGLRAGRPVSDSIGIVVETSKGPVHREFTRCHDEICMGETLSNSLARLQARVATPEVSFFAVATSLQAETGGNMIETMENLAGQLRERRKLRKKARALSSEARASALILASLPFAVALAIAVLNGAYLAPLYSDPRGQMMSAVAVTSIGLGVFMMRQMGKLDV
ncbi:type II secretion system F family protein [Sulfitobacter guttiformis]|uniref:Tight adherence protein B n=1 Tax=Sulfitobacter guttiformis TaxID=74349 RepID=A0A420DK93_9RHOB|nr:type II secretion system F family protein [Sulfitobacter guttiformis]KIN71542.1 Type II secretion system protein [Sulfitobacter guttiformis KCTC 32187]RKE94621.1 tight adherence protein B [Sulfitobacter guttiformis]